MKRTIHGRILETGLLILAWPISLGWCFCYLTVAVSPDIAGRVIGVWSES